MILKAAYLFVAAATIIHQTESAPSSTKDIIGNSNGIFSNYLYSNLSAINDGNLLISPLSINYALTAISLGAGGNSITQLRTVLNQPKDQGSIISSYKNFADNANSDNVKLLTRLYLDVQFDVLPKFRDDLHNGFNTSIQNLDFANYPDDAVNTINKYVQKETKDKINDVIQKGSITSDTKAVIVSTTYFESSWRNPFAESDTKRRPFHAQGADYQVDMMFKANQQYKYLDNKEISAQIIEIPYEGDHSLLVILPRDQDGIDAVEQKIKAKAVSSTSSPFIDIFKDASWEAVDVFLPKIDYQQYFYLKDTLQKMGLTDVFNGDADFSNLSNAKVRFSDVFQKVHFEVKESGSFAASSSGQPNKPNNEASPLLVSASDSRTTFNANHPFLYVVKLGSSNAPLLIGKYLQP